MGLCRVGISALRGVRNSSSVTSVPPGYSKLSGVKERFNIEDGTPVYKKNGSFDRVLYGLTMIICGTAVGINCKSYFDFSLR